MTPRKQPAKATASRSSLPLPLPAIRREIWEAACELILSGERIHISAVLAARFRTTERVINSALVAEGMRYEREAAMLRNGLLNALELSRPCEQHCRATRPLAMHSQKCAAMSCIRVRLHLK